MRSRHRAVILVEFNGVSYTCLSRLYERAVELHYILGTRECEEDFEVAEPIWGRFSSDLGLCQNIGGSGSLMNFFSIWLKHDRRSDSPYPLDIRKEEFYEDLAAHTGDSLDNLKRIYDNCLKWGWRDNESRSGYEHRVQAMYYRLLPKYRGNIGRLRADLVQRFINYVEGYADAVYVSGVHNRLRVKYGLL